TRRSRSTVRSRTTTGRRRPSRSWPRPRQTRSLPVRTRPRTPRPKRLRPRSRRQRLPKPKSRSQPRSPRNSRSETRRHAMVGGGALCTFSFSPEGSSTTPLPPCRSPNLLMHEGSDKGPERQFCEVEIGGILQIEEREVGRETNGGERKSG